MLQFYIWAGMISAILIFIYLIICVLIKNKPGFRITLFTITIVFGFTLYLYGYLNLYLASDVFDYTKSILRALLSTIRMFLIDTDYSEITENAISGDIILSPYYLIPYWTCHILAPITTVLAAISLFGRRLKLITKTLLSFRKERYIILGVNQKSLCFAGNIMSDDDGKLNKKRLAIFIDEDADLSSRDKIYSMGGIIVENSIFSGDSLSKKSLFYAGFSKLKLYKKIYIFAFTEKEITNSIIANNIIIYANEFKYPNTYLKGIFVHTDSDVIIDDLESKVDKLNKREYNIKYFCEEELAARKLFGDNPLYRCLEFDKDTGLAKQRYGEDKPAITILIMGFGVCGKHILRRAIMNGQFVDCRIKAIVFDNMMDTLEGKFKNKYPGLFMKNSPNHIDIEFRNDDIGSISFYNYLEDYIISNGKESICKIDYVVTCLGDDYKNLDVMTDIRNYMLNQNVKRLPFMAAHIADNKYQLFNSKDDYIGRISIFGDYNDIFTYEIIIEEQMDRLAMMVDEIGYGGRNWAGLTNHEKNSNRAFAAYIGAYLYILGFSLIDGKQKKDMDSKKHEYKLASESELIHIFDGLKKEVEIPSSDSILENLGMTEHLRWNAFHFSNGWTVKPIDEIEDSGTRKDIYRKKHGCLISWQGLSDLGGKLCNNKYIYRKYDKSIVAMTYDIIKAYNNINDISEDNRLYIINGSKCPFADRVPTDTER